MDIQLTEKDFDDVEAFWDALLCSIARKIKESSDIEKKDKDNTMV